MAARLTGPSGLQTFLFDLDGTLSDPGLGFVRSIRFAMDELGVDCPPDSQLASYIGPPLQDSMREIMGPETDARRIDRAIALYRQRYRQTGMFENEAYSGISDILELLCGHGKTIIVATAKPTPFAIPIIEHFGWTGHFLKIYGSEFDGRFTNKAELIAQIRNNQQFEPTKTIMIGDRRHDIVAGQQNDLYTCGVTWGYGSRSELDDAAPDMIISKPDELVDLL